MSLKLDPSLFLPLPKTESLYLENGSLIAVEETEPSIGIGVKEAITQIGIILSKQEVTERDEILKRFHFLNRIDRAGFMVPLPSLFPNISSWTALGKSSVLVQDHLLLSEKRRHELLLLLGFNPKSPPKPLLGIELVQAKRGDFQTLKRTDQIEVLIELCEESTLLFFREQLRAVFATYSTAEVLEATGLNTLRKGAVPDHICVTLTEWVYLFSDRHWTEVPEAVFFLLVSSIGGPPEWTLSPAFSKETLRKLYFQRDPELASLFFCCSKIGKMRILWNLLPANTSEDFINSQKIVAKAPLSSLHHFFLKSKQLQPTAYIGRLLSPEQISQLAPPLFKNGVTALLQNKGAKSQPNDPNLTAWLSLLIQKITPNDDSLSIEFFSIAKSIGSEKTNAPFLENCSSELLWSLLSAVSQEYLSALLFCEQLSKQKWEILLQRPSISVIIILFGKGQLELACTLEPFLNFLNNQDFSDIATLDLLIQGCNTYLLAESFSPVHHVLEELKEQWEKRLQRLLAKGIPNFPTPASERFFITHIETFSKKRLAILGPLKKQAFLSHIVKLKLPELKTILKQLPPPKEGSFEEELIAAIDEKEERLISLWWSMKLGEEGSLDAFNKYGEKQT